MKKFLMMACMMLFSTAMFAQQGAMYLGGNLNYGLHSDYKNLQELWFWCEGTV